MKKTKRFHFSSFQIGVLVGVIIAFGLAAFAIKDSYFFSPNRFKSDPMLIQGFDFRKFRTSNKVWRGPDLGEKIDLLKFKNADGKTLSEIVNKKHIFMIVVLDPECAICNVSGDLINAVRKGLEPLEIEYFPVSFSNSADLTKLDNFSNSLAFQSKTFLWTKDFGLPQESLQNILTLSHLLLDKNGTVIQVWAGSSREITDRESMSRQIIADTMIIKDTLTVFEQ